MAPRTVDDMARDYSWVFNHFTGPQMVAYQRFRDYYDGIQPLLFSSEKYINKYGTLFEKFAYNRCSSVVDALADRLQLERMDVKTMNGVPVPEGELSKNIELALERINSENRMDARQGEQIRESLMCGDAYVMVWPRPTLEGDLVAGFYFQDADECVVRFDRELMVRKYAAKVWKEEESGKWRVTMYYPDYVYKFITEAKTEELPKDLSKFVQWEPDPLDVESGLLQKEPWPLENPYGEVPVFHFGNNARTGALGRSELKDVIPLQDAMNKACTDMLVAMESSAFRQRFATGLQLGLPDPITGKILSPFKSGAGEVWTGPAGASFGDFEETNLEQFLAVQNDYDSKISNVSRIPKHWLDMSGGQVSGETLKTADAPMVKKLVDRQISYGDTWEDAYSLGLKQMGYPGVRLSAIWANAELRSDKDTAEVSVLRKSFGVSDAQLQRENGYDEATIERMIDENNEKVLEAQKVMTQGNGLLPSGGGDRLEPPSEGTPSGIVALRSRAAQR